jgi:hypothetical protein
MQYITKYPQVPVFLDPGMSWHEAFEEFTWHQADFIEVVSASRQLG